MSVNVAIMKKLILSNSKCNYILKTFLELSSQFVAQFVVCGTIKIWTMLFLDAYMIKSRDKNERQIKKPHFPYYSCTIICVYFVGFLLQKSMFKKPLIINYYPDIL